MERTWDYTPEHHPVTNICCSHSSKHWECLFCSPCEFSSSAWCSIGVRRHHMDSPRANSWCPGRYGLWCLSFTLVNTHRSRQTYQYVIKAWDDSRLGRCCHGNQAILDRWSSIFTVLWAAPWKAAMLSTSTRHDTIGYSPLQLQGLSSWRRH